MEMPGFQAIEHEQRPLEDQRPSPPPSSQEEDYLFNLANRFSGEDLRRLEEMGYDNSNELLKKDMDYLETYLKDVSDDVKKKKK